MAFQRPHPRQRRTCEEHKAELGEENYHLRSELQTEVNLNRQNERRINQLERDTGRSDMICMGFITRKLLVYLIILMHKF